jgi:hypothetical protein
MKIDEDDQKFDLWMVDSEPEKKRPPAETTSTAR